MGGKVPTKEGLEHAELPGKIKDISIVSCSDFILHKY